MEFKVKFAVDDEELSTLHALAFESAVEVQPWAARLDRHALTWVGAFSKDLLVGFVQVCWDGGAHAFLLDTMVVVAERRRRHAASMVKLAADKAKDAGCEWLHVDFEPHLRDFYIGVSGFRLTDAGLIALR